MILVTSRLTLREAASRDVAALSTYQRDRRYLAARASVGERAHYAEPLDAAGIVEQARRWATESPRLNYQFIVTLAAGGSVIGCAGLRQAGYPPGEAEVGIELHPDHWGSGYAREALSRLVDFARDDLTLTQISAFTAPTNRRAHNLLQRMGFSPASSLHHEIRFQLELAVT